MDVNLKSYLRERERERADDKMKEKIGKGGIYKFMSGVVKKGVREKRMAREEREW